MIWFILFCFVSVIVCDNFTYNSSDLSYPGKTVQFSVLNSDNKTENEDVHPHISQFHCLSKLNNHYKWENNLIGVDIRQCRNDMVIYLRELKNGTSWAAKSK